MKLIGRGWISKAAAALCLGNPLILVLAGEWQHEPLGWPLFLLFFLFLSPIVAAPSIFLYLLVRWRDHRPLRLTILGLSAALVGHYGWVAATADLTTSSTAALGLVAYPLYQFLFAGPVALLLVTADHFLQSRKRT